MILLRRVFIYDIDISYSDCFSLKSPLGAALCIWCPIMYPKCIVSEKVKVREEKQEPLRHRKQLLRV